MSKVSLDGKVTSKLAAIACVELGNPTGGVVVDCTVLEEIKPLDISTIPTSCSTVGSCHPEGFLLLAVEKLTLS